MLCKPLKLLASVAVLTLLTPNALQAQAIDWNESEDAVWAHGCDFQGNVVGSAQITGEECSNACGRESSCSHFVWSNLVNGGTCWFKYDDHVTTNDAYYTSVPSAVCGVMKSHTSALKERYAEEDALYAEAVNYIPIFRFDDGAKDYCFPDDKLLWDGDVQLRNNICNDFNPTAPVYVHSKTCGEFTVHQYNLWYGKQKGCLPWGRGGVHDNDNEYVQVWTTGTRVASVRYNQHGGWYFRGPINGAEMQGKRPVVHIGKIAHGAYHFGCTGNWWYWDSFCSGGCMYMHDFRNSADSKFVLSDASPRNDPWPREINCDDTPDKICDGGEACSARLW